MKLNDVAAPGRAGPQRILASAGIALWTLLLAGCAHNDKQQASLGAPPDAPPVSAEFSSTLSGSDCKLVRGLYYYAGESPHLPPGWELKNNWPGRELQLDVYECSRLSWGPFERGPIFVMIEGYRGFEAPAACEEGDWNLIGFIISIGFSDPEIAAHARQAYDLPAWSGEFRFNESANAPFTESQWTWTPEGGSASSFDHNGTHLLESSSDETYRWLWANETAASYMDWNEVAGQIHNGDLQILTGHVREPVFYPEVGPDPYVSIGNMSYDLDARSEIHRFGDLNCEQPL